MSKNSRQLMACNRVERAVRKLATTSFRHGALAADIAILTAVMSGLRPEDEPQDSARYASRDELYADLKLAADRASERMHKEYEELKAKYPNLFKS